MLRMFRRIPLAMSLVASAIAVLYDPYLPSTKLAIHGGQKGIVRDEIGNALTNVSVTVASPFDGNYGYFSGAGNLSIADNPDWYFGSGDATVEGWVYWDGVVNSSGYISLWGQNPVSAANMRVGIIDATGTLQASIDSDSNLFTSSIKMPAKTWVHLAYVKSGTTFTLYVNGIAGGSKVSAAALPDLYAPWYIGTEEGLTNYSHKGFFDSFRITKGVARYTSNFTPAKLVMDNTDQYWDQTVLAINFEIGPVDLKGHIVTNSGVVVMTTGMFDDSSIYFNGSAYLTTPYVPASFDWWTSDFTVETMVKSGSWANWTYSSAGLDMPAMLGNASLVDSACYWSFGPASDGGVVFYYFNGSPVYYKTTTKLSVNTWHHISAVKKGSTVTIFIDGVASGTFSVVGTPQSNAGYKLNIGAINNKGIVGHLAELRITKGVSRYSELFTAPVMQFMDYRAADYYWDQTTFLMQGDSLADARGNTLTNSGVSVSSTEQLFGKSSLYFNGAASFKVNQGGNNFNVGTGDFTLEFNIKANEPQSSKFLCGFRNPGNDGLHITTGGISSTVGTIRVATNAGNVCASTSRIDNGVWNHVAVVRRSGVIYIFINGVLEASANNTTAIAPAAGRPCFGVNDYTSESVSDFFTGHLAGIRFTKHVARYSANFSTPNTVYSNYGSSGPVVDLYSKYTKFQATLEDLVDHYSSTMTVNGGANFTATNARNGKNVLRVPGNGSVSIAGTNAKLGAGDFTLEFNIYNTASYASWAGYLDSRVGGGSANSPIVTNNWSGSTILFSDSVSRLAGTLPLNQWAHVAIVRIGTTLYMYIDGVQVATAANVTNDYSSPFNRIGASYDNYFANCFMSDLRITQYARYRGNFIKPDYVLPH